MANRSFVFAFAMAASTFLGAPSQAATSDELAAVKSALGIVFNSGSNYLSSIGSYNDFISALYTQATSNWANLFGFFNTTAALTTGYVANTSTLWTAELTFDSTNKTVASFGKIVNPAQNTITPVPGPIAAAGLPAVLGLMGFAAWKRRRGALAA